MSGVGLGSLVEKKTYEDKTDNDAVRALDKGHYFSMRMSSPISVAGFVCSRAWTCERSALDLRVGLSRSGVPEHSVQLQQQSDWGSRTDLVRGDGSGRPFVRCSSTLRPLHVQVKTLVDPAPAGPKSSELSKARKAFGGWWEFRFRSASRRHRILARSLPRGFERRWCEGVVRK